MQVRVAPNIFRTPHGWRVYVWRNGKPRPVRFKRDVPLEDVIAFRDAFQAESRALRQRGSFLDEPADGGFAADARRYLDLPTTKAMPSYTDRVRDIKRWSEYFGDRPRRSVQTRHVDDQLQRWIDAGVAPSTVNKRRTALMAMWTRLDGRGSANPVRDAKVFEEPEAAPRGLPYDLVVRILDAVPEARGYSHLRSTKTTPLKTRARLEVMAWTGMRPSQLMRLTPDHLSLKERWFVTPRSQKGRRRTRHPRPMVRKPLTAQAVAALKRFVALDCWGPFSTSSVYRIFKRAVREVEQDLRRERRSRTFRLPKIRPYDLRHSFASEMFRQTKNLPLVQELLDHSSMTTTKRYALGAVPEALRAAARAFDVSAPTDRTPGAARRPAPPRRRRT